MNEVKNLVVKLKVEADTKTAQRNLEDVGKSAEKTAGSVDKLNKTAKSAGGGGFGGWAKSQWKDMSGGGGFDRGLVNKIGQFADMPGLSDTLKLGKMAGRFAFSPAGAVAGLAAVGGHVGFNLAQDNFMPGGEGQRSMDKQFQGIVEYFASWFVDNGEAAMKKGLEKRQAAMQQRMMRSGMQDLALGQEAAAFELSLGAQKQADKFDALAVGYQKGLVAPEQFAQQEAIHETITLEKALEGVYTEQANILTKIRDEYGVAAMNDENIIRKEQLALLNRQKGLMEQLLGVKYKEHEAERTKAALIIKNMETEKQAAQQSIDSAKSALAAKQQGIVSAQQEFALAGRADQAEILRIAGKFEKGGLGSLNQGEIAFGKQYSSIFGEAMRTQSAGVANQAGFQDLARNTALGLNTNVQEAALKAAEKLKVEIENKIAVQIQVNNEKLGRDLVDRVKDALQQLGLVTEQIKILQREQRMAHAANAAPISGKGEGR